MRRAIAHLKKADPVLRAIVERVGPYRIRYAEPDFETVARSIVFQQLSGQSARAIFGRVKALVAGNGRMTPHGVLTRTEAELRGAGLSRRKAEYVRDLAEKTRAGDIDFVRLSTLSDDDVIRQLTMVRGVGVWTAQEVGRKEKPGGETGAGGSPPDGNRPRCWSLRTWSVVPHGWPTFSRPWFSVHRQWTTAAGLLLP